MTAKHPAELSIKEGFHRASLLAKSKQESKGTQKEPPPPRGGSFWGVERRVEVDRTAYLKSNGNLRPFSNRALHRPPALWRGALFFLIMAQPVCCLVKT